MKQIDTFAGGPPQIELAEVNRSQTETDEQGQHVPIREGRESSNHLKRELTASPGLEGFSPMTRNSNHFLMESPDRRYEENDDMNMEFRGDIPELGEVRNPIYENVELEENTLRIMKNIESNHLIPKNFQDILYVSDVVKVEFLEVKQSIQSIDVWLCVAAFLTIAISTIDNMHIAGAFNLLENTYEINRQNHYYRLFVMGINIISVILIVSRYYKLLRAHKLRTGTIADHDDLTNTGLIRWMWLEICINGIFVPPYFNRFFTMKGSIYVTYDYTQSLFNVNNLKALTNTTSVASTLMAKDVSVKLYYNMSCAILFFILFRIYHVFRLVNSYSFFTTPKAQSICSLMNSSASLKFALKSYIKINPFGVLLFSMGFIIGVFGISVHILEFYNAQIMNLMSADGNIYVQIMHQFSNFLNALWLIVVTMTTIGYGDIYPTTYFGRIVATLTCIFGTLVLSLLVVFTNQSLKLDDIERHVYQQVMEGQENPNNLRREASSLIGIIMKYNYLRKKHERDGTTLYRLYLWIELKYNSKRFKIKRINMRKYERDIDEILGDFTLKMENDLAPFKNCLADYHKSKGDRENTFSRLKQSNVISEKLLRNSMQMYNLLKVLNKEKSLPGLTHIEEVYDAQVNVLDEIIYYHDNKNKLPSIDDKVLKEIQPVDSLHNTVIIDEKVQESIHLDAEEDKPEDNVYHFKSSLYPKKDNEN